MEHKLINTGDYLLIVDEDVTKAKEDCWMYRDDVKQVYCDKNFWWDFKEPYKKIIAHLPLNNSPIFEGVDLLPPLEDESKELAEIRFTGSDDITNYNLKFGFTEGYNKAKKKYKYTEEDMIKAILFGMQKGLNVGKVDETDSNWVNNYVKFLQQPKMPVGFKCEMITMNKGYTEESDYPYQQCDIPKTTTNSQGLTQWVGEYIYD